MKPSKPITPKMREKANALYRIMQDNKWHTKEELAERMGIKNERSMRDVIATLSTKKPIISTSDNRGYKLAMTKGDIELVKQTWMEIDSRQEELEKRKKPLIDFYELAQKVVGR